MATERKITSTNHRNQQQLAATCVLNELLRDISGRWKMQVLYLIAQGHNQFSRLQVALPLLSDQMLGKRLRELEAQQLLSKELLPSCVPPQIHYIPTAKAQTLLALLDGLCEWGTGAW